MALTEIQFKWNVLQDNKNTFKYRSLLNRGDSMDRFDSIYIVICITYTGQDAVRGDLELPPSDLYNYNVYCIIVTLF